MSSAGGPVRIEAVCTGNVCRSPYLQVMLHDALEAIAPGDFEVVSSGTHALVGQRAEDHTRSQLRARGHVIQGFRAQQVTPRRLQHAHLILVMDQVQRTSVLDELPAAMGRTFLLPELARLVRSLGQEKPWADRLSDIPADDPIARWQRVARAAHAARSRFGTDHDDVVADPYRQRTKAFVAMAEQIDACIEPLVAIESEARSSAVTS